MKNIACAFTLAEIMIVLVVIGILTGILVPAAMNSMPNENVMKFKKAHNTLYRVINELVSSDKYYADGDLGIRASNGELIDGTHNGDNTYLCNSVADVLSIKSADCKDVNTGIPWTDTGLEQKEGRIYFDTRCKDAAAYKGKTDEIITTDNISFFQDNPKLPFGIITTNAWVVYTPNEAHNPADYRLFSAHSDNNGFYRIYKVICIDIDGIPSGGSKNCDDNIDICPFGYGIRVDGKILTGVRADEWLSKSIHPYLCYYSFSCIDFSSHLSALSPFNIFPSARIPYPNGSSPVPMPSISMQKTL